MPKSVQFHAGDIAHESKEAGERDVRGRRGDRNRERTHPGEAIRFRDTEETLLKAKSHGPVTFAKTVLLYGS